MTKEENELMTQTGAGTPCGELMRRYWQPVAISRELPRNGSLLSVKILGEELVLFRNNQGQPGLLGLHCSHRGADLSYGRVEDGGIRCIYHGWLYDLAGRCIDQPGEPQGGTQKQAIRHPAYPCHEKSGAIFAYLGPGEPPLFNGYEFLSAPDDHTYVEKRYHECNYLQANEGNFDLSHLGFLHYNFKNGGIGGVGYKGPPVTDISGRGSAPEVEHIETELKRFGVRCYKIRPEVEPGKYYFLVHDFILPNLTCFPGYSWGGSGYMCNWHVPIDNTAHWKYTFLLSRRGPVNSELLQRRADRVDAEYKPVRNKSNGYLQDRKLMDKTCYSGIWSPDGGVVFQTEDLLVVEGQGAVQDRTQEHLVPSDIVLVAARKALVKAIRDLQEGLEPDNVVRNANSNRFPVGGIQDLFENSVDWKEYAKRLDADVV